MVNKPLEKKILFVDDDQSILGMLNAVFHARGYSPYCTTNGHEALKIMAEEHIRVVFTDLQMPVLDGMTLCRRALEQDPQAQVFGVSGYTETYSDDQYAEAGFAGQFPKPYNALDLMAACDEALAKLGQLDSEEQSMSPRSRSPDLKGECMSPVHKRAIILEDDDGIRYLVGRVLSSCGYSVKSYSSPTEETLFSHPEKCPVATGHGELFDESPTCAEVIITDNNMPDVSGIEYVRKIRRAGCRVRHIAMMSGDWREEALLEAKALGCKVFAKPVSNEEMRDWVSSLEYE